MIGLDKTDFKILRILQENGRITNIQLSVDIGLSPAPTLERVRKLEQMGFIKSYHAQVNEELLGLNLKTFLLISLNYQKSDAITSFINQVNKIDEIIECYHISGIADFLLKIVVSDVSKLEKLLIEKIGKMQEIAQIKTNTVLSTSKLIHKLPMDN
jgi:Lrp/AsnC family leucine-responsive transcriptional regulator